MNIQTFLQNEGNPSDLTETLGIKAARDKQYDNLYLFNYSQIDSPKNHPIVIESRALILDADNNWQVVSRSYDRFFNYGEGPAADIDWQSTFVYEKLDGSLMVLYNYNKEWRVQTRGVSNAECKIGTTHTYYKDFFWQLFQQNNYQLPKLESCCFIFELMSRYNKVVVDYPKPRLALHGVRNKLTMQEYNHYPLAQSYNFDYAKVYPALSQSNPENVIKYGNTTNGYDLEGFVCVDKNFNRIKIKTEEWYKLNRIKVCYSLETMLALVQQRKTEDFCIIFLEYQHLLESLEADLFIFLREVYDVYSKLKYIESQKEFALQAIQYRFQSLLFEARKTGKELTEIVYALPAKKLLQLLIISSSTYHYFNLGNVITEHE